MHTELRFGNGVTMLGTAPQTAESGHGVPSAHGVYVHVEDVDAHFNQAQAAGAEIVFPPKDTERGTRRDRALASEGYEWSFGNYRSATDT